MNKDRCRIANAYIQSGRIANPTEQAAQHWRNDGPRDTSLPRSPLLKPHPPLISVPL